MQIEKSSYHFFRKCFYYLSFFKSNCSYVKKKYDIVLVATTDIVADQRIQKMATTLSNSGFSVLVVGRNAKPMRYDFSSYLFDVVLLRTLFRKGPLFYLFFNVQLFFFVARVKLRVIVANDLDVMLASVFIKIVKKTRLVYDSHEWFIGVPELIERPFVAKVWKSLERFSLPKVDEVITVSDSISKLFFESYKVKPYVVKNYPNFQQRTVTEYVSLPEDKKNLLYQGALNKDRGIEYLIMAMSTLDSFVLYIAGDGDLSDDLKALVARNNLSHKVVFLGRLLPSQLVTITKKAFIGFSLEIPTCLNYRYALPNKIFDYIQAGVPVIVSNLPEMSEVVKKYGVGLTCNDVTSTELLDLILKLDSNPDLYSNLKANCNFASSELTWQSQEELILSVYKHLL